MKLTVEQKKELANFPAALRTLVERELKAGNSIVEVGHTHPAPPAGAYFKMAKKVMTRPRASGRGLDFYDRKSTISSGEFTDAKRFYFVIEPPDPPPPEPDMDAIRQEIAERVAKSDALRAAAQEAERAACLAESKRKAGTKSKRSKARRQPRSTEAPERGPRLPKHSILQSSTKTSAKWLLHFQDSRPPQEIQFYLERILTILMPPRMEAGKLVWNGTVNMTGAPYSILLTFEAALPTTNCYSLRVEVSWADSKEEYHDYYQKSSAGWFDFWTEDFRRASPPTPGAGSVERYQQLCEAALNAETHLNSVEAIEQVVVARMKRGFGFSTANKEGGTRIYWDETRFVSSDYGESNEIKEYTNEAEFLKYLFQFYEWQTRTNVYPERLPPFDVWKLILRFQHTK